MVKEVFISRKLNRKGRKFGFVKFLEVKNVKALEKQLDNIWIENLKLKANLSRYNRDHDGMKWENGYNQTPGPKKKTATLWRKKPDQPSYAQIAKNELLSKEVWKGVEFDTEELEIELLNESFVGRMHNPDDLESLKDNFILGGMGFLKVRYLGDNMVLITSSYGTKINTLIEENSIWFATMFKSLLPWSREQLLDSKSVWVRCFGLPISLWNKQCLAKVVAGIGVLMAIDEATLN